jgi:alpha-1,3-mannosyltransferase
MFHPYGDINPTERRVYFERVILSGDLGRWQAVILEGQASLKCDWLVGQISTRREQRVRSPMLTQSFTAPHEAGPTPTPKPTSNLRDGNATLLEIAPAYIKAIMSPEDNSFPRLDCPAPGGSRYDYLRKKGMHRARREVKPKYFFALDLHQCANLLPRLIGSVVEAMRFLGPENCALSIVEGRSDDGTFEILKVLRQEIEDIGATYFFNSTDLDPSSGARIAILAELRNMALEPLTHHSDNYDPDTTVIFLNDVAICMEDILELIHQRVQQNADMTCAMDWTYAGVDPTFYDVWIARDIKGDTFFNIPEDGNWNSAWNLFWNNAPTQQRYGYHKPFQVFSCWNGAVTFTAKPLLQHNISFHSSNSPPECFRGEPEILCKEMWKSGYGKIAVVPSVNLEYSDEQAKKIKALKGYTSQWVGKDGDDSNDESLRIEWEKNPPAVVKCMSSYQNQTWVPWDEGLA